MSFFEELKRRNVFRVGVAYIVASWVLLQVAELVLDAIKAPDWVIQAMLLFVVLGFIAAMIIAWAYEMTPEGLRRESEIERSESITNQTAARLDRITIVLLVLVVAIIVVERFVLTAPPVEPAATTAEAGADPAREKAAPAMQAAEERSVAVLPFVALSSGEDDEYFADGLTEEILNSLAQLPELLVTARTSSFSFKGQDVPVQEIAVKLGVQNIVEGSVRRAGDRLRVTAQLIRAADGFHVWSENYDSTAEDTIQVQEDIAEKIARAMNVVMDETKREAMREAGLRDVEAFIAMQKAREWYQKAHGDTDPIAALRAANEWYEQVLQIVPGYPPALEEHSDLWVHMLNDHVAGVPMTNVTDADIAHARVQVIEDISRALENARNFVEQNEFEISLAMVSSNWRGIQGRIQRYLEGSGCDKPSWSPQFALPFSDAEAYARRIAQATECDPLSSSNWFDESRAWLWAGDAERALQVARRGMEVAPGGWIPFTVRWSLLASGRFEELAHQIDQDNMSDYDRLAVQHSRAAAMGNRSEADVLFKRLQAFPDHGGFVEMYARARSGDRRGANHLAARIDQDPWGSPPLMAFILWCICGAPWDLEATPNFAADLEEGGLSWPPPSPITWPLKDW